MRGPDDDDDDDAGPLGPWPPPPPKAGAVWGIRRMTRNGRRCPCRIRVRCRIRRLRGGGS